MIKVSVIVPAYNTENYIKDCIESLIHQTLEELEVIIVDDGSKDRTLQVLKAYEEKHPQRVKVLHKENGGQASARNLALQHAKGEYLGFVDSDDWVDLKMYELMYEKAVEENADIVVCDMIRHYPDKTLYNDYTNVSNKIKFANSSCNKIFRREFAQDITFPEGLWYEDFEYSTKQILKTDLISVVHEGLYQYNCRDGSTMNNSNAQKNKDILTVLDHVTTFVEQNGWEEKYRKELEYLYIEHVLHTTINRLEEQDNKEKREVINYIRKEVTKKYPHFYKSEDFQEYEVKKRILTFLNAIGLSWFAKGIFDVKRFMRERKNEKS